MREAGQSFFEVVVALAIVSLVLVAIVVPATVSIRNSAASRDKARATRYAQETVEWLRSERDSDWASFATRANTPVWCLTKLDWNIATVGTCSQAATIPESFFQREINFTNIGATTVEATVKVFWSDSLGFKEVRTSTYFTDWRRE